MASIRGTAKYWLYNFVPGFAGSYPYYGSTVFFPGNSLLLKVVCEAGIFEGDIVRRMERLARPDSTVFDVGANLGLMSVPVLNACPTCRVVSFEPSPSSLPFLHRTAAASRFRDRWTIVGKALGDRAGELDFVVGSSAEALFEGFRSGDRITGGRVVKVPVSTLDDEWRALGEPDVSLIKIDVEGAEGGVLAGGRALLARRPAVLIEWASPYLDRFGTPATELLRVASDVGYRIFTVPAGVPVDDQRALMAQMIDCQNFLLL